MQPHSQIHHSGTQFVYMYVTCWLLCRTCFPSPIHCVCCVASDVVSTVTTESACTVAIVIVSAVAIASVIVASDVASKLVG